MASTATSINLDLFGEMSKQEYLVTIFGPSLNKTNTSFCQKMKNILTSTGMHMFIIVFVLLDCLCVTVELIVSFEKEENHTIHMVENFFKYLGLTILTMFLFELILKIIFINKELLKSKLELFDGLIVIISFLLEMIFLQKKSSIEALGNYSHIIFF